MGALKIFAQIMGLRGVGGGLEGEWISERCHFRTTWQTFIAETHSKGMNSNSGVSTPQKHFTLGFIFK